MRFDINFWCFKLYDEGRLQSSFLAVSTIAGVDPQKIYQLNTVVFYRKYLLNSFAAMISNSPNLATFALGNIFNITLAPSSFLL